MQGVLIHKNSDYAVFPNVTMCFSKNLLLRPEFVVAKGPNLLEVTRRLFAAGGSQSLFWPEATTFEWSQKQDHMVTSCFPQPKKQQPWQHLIFAHIFS